MIKKIMPHITLILFIVSLTLFILTKFNPGILNLGFYNVCMYLFFASVLISSIVSIAANRK